MTAANVASTQKIGRTGTSGVVTALALAVALLAGVAMGAFAIRATTTTAQAAPAAVAPTTHQPRVGPMAAPGTAATAATAQMTNYRQLVANLAAARNAHDFRSIYRIDRALDAMLTPVMIGMVYQEHARLAANLEAAHERHDMRAQALISRQVQELCGWPDVQSRLTFCY